MAAGWQVKIGTPVTRCQLLTQTKDKEDYERGVGQQQQQTEQAALYSSLLHTKYCCSETESELYIGRGLSTQQLAHCPSGCFNLRIVTVDNRLQRLHRASIHLSQSSSDGYVNQASIPDSRSLTALPKKNLASQLSAVHTT